MIFQASLRDAVLFVVATRRWKRRATIERPSGTLSYFRNLIEQLTSGNA